MRTTAATFSPLDFTVCTWLRTIDTTGGILAYVAPASGTEFALYLRPVDAAAGGPYVLCATMSAYAVTPVG